MKHHILIRIYLTYFLAVYTLCHASPIVVTPSGPIKGVIIPTLGQDVVQFRNIPYAKPPLGELRFSKPERIDPWTETLDGTKFGPSCIQSKAVMDHLWDYIDNKEISEDCLQLNVFVPGSVTVKDKKPVMVWIHGGGFTMGSGHAYDASFLAMKGVIVVTINYRLGVLGFLSTGDKRLPGNYGLWDQIEALEWVKTNIASFGGDPDAVTIFGESAGGFAVSYLALMPRNKGLFKRIIPQSGSPAGVMGVAKSPFRLVKAIGKYLGCDDNAVVNCLRQKTADDILEAQSDQSVINLVGMFSPLAWPVIDNDLIVREPLESLLDPNSIESVFFRSLDMMAGVTSNEGSLSVFILAGFQESMGFNMTDGAPTSFLCDVLAPEVAKSVFDNETIISDMLCKKYSSDNPEEQGRNIADLFADVMFVSPTVKLIDYHSKDKSKLNSYQYLYDEALDFMFLMPLPPWMKGAEHGSDLMYLFGPGKFNTMHSSLSTDEGRAFTDVMVTYWTNFAKTGNPNGKGLVQWNAYTTIDREYLVLKKDGQFPRKKLFNDRLKFLHEDLPNTLENRRKTEL